MHKNFVAGDWAMWIATLSIEDLIELEVYLSEWENDPMMQPPPYVHSCFCSQDKIIYQCSSGHTAAEQEVTRYHSVTSEMPLFTWRRENTRLPMPHYWQMLQKAQTSEDDGSSNNINQEDI
jgi:hypothetical protein